MTRGNIDGINFGRRSFLVGASATAAMLACKVKSRPSILANPLLPPLVFIPGIKGSVLSDTHGNVRWLNVWQALGLSSADLSLPARWNGEVQERDALVATGPLGAVGWHEIYAPFLYWASASRRVFRPFAYDWRRDNLETADKFVEYLEKISRENGGSRVQVVAHSMGGLITFLALNRRPDLFHSVLFAGVPFGASISFLEDMHAGTSTGLNSRILSPQVLFTFASPYTLLPTDPKESGLVGANGEHIVHDWFSADDWARQKLGIFAASGSNVVTAAQQEHLGKALDRARAFRKSLICEESVSYPPIAVLAGDALPTLMTAKRDGPLAVKGWDFVSEPKKSGDNRVAFETAVPPLGVPYSIFKSSRSHEDLLNDTSQVAMILSHLAEHK